MTHTVNTHNLGDLWLVWLLAHLHGHQHNMQKYCLQEYYCTACVYVSLRHFHYVTMTKLYTLYTVHVNNVNSVMQQHSKHILRLFTFRKLVSTFNREFDRNIVII